MKMKKLFALAASALMLTSAFVACGAPSNESSTESSKKESSVASKEESKEESKSEVELDGDISASGSSALYPLADLAASNFMDMHDVVVTVEAGGSGTGLNNVAQGISTIGNSDIFAEEKLDAETAATLVDYKACTVTMAAVVNPSLGIDNLTKQQLTDIFTGKVTNWKDVGGKDLDILLITRPSSSGTRALFETYGMTEKPAEDFVGGYETDNSGELTDKVKANEGAIGYVAMSYFMGDDELVALSVDGVEPTLENTYDGSYTIWGYEHMYTKGEATGTAKAFIDYMLGEEFAPEIEANGYGVTARLSPEAIATHEVQEEIVELDGDISASGSSALYPLADLAAANFMDMHDVVVTVEAGGSGTGLNNVAQGISTIGNSDIFAEEKLDAETAATLVDYKACTVTMAAVVNPSLGIDNLTKQQLTDIFTGKVTNWSEVGGKDLEILLITRPSSSGTRALFETYGMTEKPAEDFVGGYETDNSGELTEKVKANEGAIGYVAMSYYMGDDELVAIAVDGVEPTLENTYDGSYTIWGYEHMYTKGEATGTAKAFIDYMLSKEFAPEIEANGYGATANLSKEAIASHE